MKNTLFLMILMALASCETVQKVKEAKEAVEATVEASQAVEQNSKIVEERRAKGDTLAMPYAELQKFLPATAEGFVKDGEPIGESVNQMGVSFAQAEQKFKDGKNGSLTVQIHDYNLFYGMIGAMTMMAAGFSSDDETKRQAGVDFGIEGVTAFEEYLKKDKIAKVTCSVNERFLVFVEAENQVDTKAVQAIAKKIAEGELYKK